MSRPRGVAKTRKSGRTETTQKCEIRSPGLVSQASRELIDLTRQLMEQTIEFVPHPLFDSACPETVINRLRPAAPELGPVQRRAQEGQAFLTELVQAPLLSFEEERYWFTWMNFLKFRAERNRRQLDLKRPDAVLVTRIQADLSEATAVRNHVVTSNLRLIVALARKFTDSLEQMSELISEGMSPLIRAVELFDIGLGNRFSTYATWAVRNQMLRSLKKSKSSPEFTSGEDAPSLENLPDLRNSTLSAESPEAIRARAVHQLLLSLTDRERQILSARFALDGEPSQQSLAEIAERVGLSKERVRQIALRSISKLRQSMTYEEFESIG